MVEFPKHVKSSDCKTVTNSEVTRGKHGATRTESTKPIEQDKRK